MSFINWGNESPEQIAIRRQIEQQAIFEQAARVRAMRAGNAPGVAGGSNQQEELPTNFIEFVLNTEEELDFEIEHEVTENTSCTINWGDGTVEEHEYLTNVNNTTSYDYAEVGEYTVRITYADPTLIRELNFEGDDEDYAMLTSITGLTNLTNLVEFRADNNQLQTIDLSGLTSLTYVDVSDNDRYSADGLTSINVSGCTALEELYIEDNDFQNNFPDLSGLTSLRRLRVDDCGLSGSVNISSLPNLEFFNLSDNAGLTSVIISSSQPLGSDGELTVADCSLTQTAVDNILVALAANPVNGGYVDLRGGTNSSPGAAGNAAIVTLETPSPGKNWSLDVN
jgi:hypothetical protein